MTPDKSIWCGCGNRRDNHPISMNGHCDTPAGEKYPDIQGIAGEGMTLQERLVSEGIEMLLGKNTEPDDAWHTAIYEEKANKLKLIILHTIEETIKEGVGEAMSELKLWVNTRDHYDGTGSYIMKVDLLEKIGTLTDTQHALRGIIG
jgi:hypothetical protein